MLEVNKMKYIIISLIYLSINSFASTITNTNTSNDNIFKTLLQYGFLGIVAYTYINNNNKNNQANREQFDTLIKKVIESNNTEKLEKAISKLENTIEKSSKFYDNSISDITTELAKLREDYKSISSQTVECFLDEKILSKSNFVTLYKMLILKHIHQSINDITYKIDQNGFDTELGITLLKENVTRIIDRRKSEMLLILNQCNYREDKINKLKNNIDLYYSVTISKIEEEILNVITTEDFKNDKNYKRVKQLFQNKLFELSDKILSDTELL